MSSCILLPLHLWTFKLASPKVVQDSVWATSTANTLAPQDFVQVFRYQILHIPKLFPYLFTNFNWQYFSLKYSLFSFSSYCFWWQLLLNKPSIPTLPKSVWMYCSCAQEFSNTAFEQPAVNEIETYCGKATYSLFTYRKTSSNTLHSAEQAYNPKTNRGRMQPQ